MHERMLISVQNSAIWAAYGDALGFISELVDNKGLARRVGSSRVIRATSWARRIGGRFGVEVMLPLGCHSDDTQLRLATCRAIRGDGLFDVEAFAKVELPVWLSYALGAGRGTRAAAMSLGHQNVNWFSNFFVSNRTNYIDCGGNGAAMRIQPHVWCAKDFSKPETYILDVVKNALCTHGHPRGILGAVFHALCLAMTLDRGHVAGPDEWAEAISYFPKVATLIRQDDELGLFWLQTWEDKVGDSIEAAFDRVRDECFSDIIITNNYVNGDRSDQNYARFVDALGGRKEDQRGSGTKTAIIAAALSFLYQDDYPLMALQAAANLLSSDTDTIATMAGAILGCLVTQPPNEDVLDCEYIRTEATRLYKIGRSHSVDSFSYPDLGKWQPPTVQLDAVGVVGDRYAVAGLGFAEAKDGEYGNQNKDATVWQWLELEFGQSVLVKRRVPPRPMPLHNLPIKYMTKHPADLKQRPELRSSNYAKDNIDINEKHSAYNGTVHKLTNDAIESGFNEELIGKHLLSLATHPDGIEKAIAYASIIIKARMARLNSRNHKQ
jgi:ADP-ribosylglycohydrolase